MGPTDTAALHSCVYWRAVANVSGGTLSYPLPLALSPSLSLSSPPTHSPILFPPPCSSPSFPLNHLLSCSARCVGAVRVRAQLRGAGGGVSGAGVYHRWGACSGLRDRFCVFVCQRVCQGVCQRVSEYVAV
eukprot:3941798-Rhodomonas_salina.1